MDIHVSTLKNLLIFSPISLLIINDGVGLGNCVVEGGGGGLAIVGGQVVGSWKNVGVEGARGVGNCWRGTFWSRGLCKLWELRGLGIWQIWAWVGGTACPVGVWVNGGFMFSQIHNNSRIGYFGRSGILGSHTCMCSFKLQTTQQAHDVENS